MIEIIKKAGKIALVGLFFFGVVANLTKLKFVAGADNSWFINPFYLNRFFVWDDANLGNHITQVADMVPLISFYQFFRLLSLQDNVIQTLYYTFFYLGAYLSFYYSFSALFPRINRVIFLITGLLYVLNPFTLVMPFQDRLFPVLVFLPIVFFLYDRLLYRRETKYAILIALVSVLYSGSNINLPVVSIIFLILLLYLVYFLLTEELGRIEYRKIFLQQLILFGSYIIANLWHLIVDIPAMLAVSEIGSKVNTFRATDSGYLFDHFRLIGQWGWYQSHNLLPYFSFSGQYYEPLLLVTTYAITIIGLAAIFFTRSRFFSTREDKLLVFFSLLFLVGVFLANGSKNTLGRLYSAIYDSSSLFWMFREPWAKFTPLLVFALPVLLSGTLAHVLKRITSGRLKNGCLVLVGILICLNSYPLLAGSAIWQKWNGTMRNFRVEVPDYWGEMNRYIENNTGPDERVALFPYNVIYSGFNWPEGFFTAGNPGLLLINRPVITSTSLPMTYSDFLYNSIFLKLKDPDLDLRKFLGVLNVKYVLQENDADWRYPQDKILPPSESNRLLEEHGFAKVKETGLFTDEYLARVPNDESNKKLRDELYRELVGKPGLVLYESLNSERYLIPRIYAPKKLIKSNQHFTELADVVSNTDFDTTSAVLFNAQNPTLQEVINYFPNSVSAPETKFVKINPTEYKVTAKNIHERFVLIFNESYNDNWQVYYSGEKNWRNWFGRPVLASKVHLVANGYANGWVLDPSSICRQSCDEVQFMIKFTSQDDYVLGALLSASAIIVFGCYLLYNHKRQRNNNVLGTKN